MNRYFSLGVAAIFTLSIVLVSGLRAEAGANPKNPKSYMTQGELAKKIAYISGIAENLPVPVTGEASANALTLQGWTPLGGWQVGAVATKQDFYVVMAKYLGLRIRDANDPRSYYEALIRSGYNFSSSATAKAVPARLEKRNVLIVNSVLGFRGNVEVRDNPGAAWRPLTKNETLHDGMALRTGKNGLIENSYIDVAYARGAAQRIFENTEVVIEKSENTPVSRQVVVTVLRGETVSLIDPSCEFVSKDPIGKFEVNRESGCHFNAIVTTSAQGISFNLNEFERKLSHGYAALAEIQAGSVAKYVVTQGVGSYFHAGAGIGGPAGGPSRVLGVGQSVSANTSSMDVAAVDPGAAINKIEQVANSVNGQTGSPLSNNSLPAQTEGLTATDLIGFLNGVGTGGISESAVTPVQ
jgi:hypothetical protein